MLSHSEPSTLKDYSEKTQRQRTSSIKQKTADRSPNGYVCGGEKTVTIAIDKEDIKFSCGHFTVFSQTERERVHGHNFSVNCSVECKVGDHGMAMDYKVIKSLLRQICGEWDEKMLIPLKCHYLDVIREGNRIAVMFNGQKVIDVMEEEVQLLPIRNITGEELSDYC